MKPIYSFFIVVKPNKINAKISDICFELILMEEPTGRVLNFQSFKQKDIVGVFSCIDTAQAVAANVLLIYRQDVLRKGVLTEIQ